MKEHWAIIGGGNGGQAFAAYLSIEGLDITLYDIFPQTVDAINKQGGIHLDGSAKNFGFGKILFASTDMEKVISNASVILVVLPSIYHNSIAQKIAPLLKDGQIVILNPITPLGTIDFQNTLTKSGCTADIVLAGTNTLLFACRAVQPGHVHVSGQKKDILISAYAPYLEGVILYSHNSNAYWPEGSEYDDDQPPLCQSFDGKVGYGEPGGTCADCVLNQFGSDGNNKGKACKNMRMLYLLRSGEYMPIQIALPPTSLTPYTRFVNEAFLSRRRKVCTGVVRIGLKKAVSGSHEYCVATFTKIADFAGEDLAHIRAYADGFVAQIKDINAQRAQAGAAASNIIGDGDASHLELPDNGAHFALGAVIDGEREELPA